MGKAFTGVTRFALEAKAPILPVGMVGTYEILPPHKKLPRLKRCHIKISKPILHQQHFDKKLTKEMLRHLTDELMWDIGLMVNKEYKHHYNYQNKIQEKKPRVIEGEVVKS